MNDQHNFLKNMHLQRNNRIKESTITEKCAKRVMCGAISSRTTTLVCLQRKENAFDWLESEREFMNIS